jgi:hypothetical protein
VLSYTPSHNPAHPHHQTDDVGRRHNFSVKIDGCVLEVPIEQKSIPPLVIYKQRAAGKLKPYYTSDAFIHAQESGDHKNYESLQ